MCRIIPPCRRARPRALARLGGGGHRAAQGTCTHVVRRAWPLQRLVRHCVASAARSPPRAPLYCQGGGPRAQKAAAADQLCARSDVRSGAVAAAAAGLRLPRPPVSGVRGGRSCGTHLYKSIRRLDVGRICCKIPIEVGGRLCRKIAQEGRIILHSVDNANYNAPADYKGPYLPSLCLPLTGIIAWVPRKQLLIRAAPLGGGRSAARAYDGPRVHPRRTALR